MAQRTVLITGGSRGIGEALAQEFLSDGHRVAVTHRGGSVPDGALGVKADVQDIESVDAAVAQVREELGPPEIVIANAGVTDDTLLMRMKEQQFQRVLDTNLTGAFRVARAAVSSMIRQRFGRLIFISSVVAMTGSAGQANYAASKAGLIGFARSLARELAPRGVTANVVSPGFVETDMTRELGEKRREEILSAVPLKRYATPDEVAASCAFLASEKASYITGAVIPVDGGLGLGH